MCRFHKNFSFKDKGYPFNINIPSLTSPIKVVKKDDLLLEALDFCCKYACCTSLILMMVAKLAVAQEKTDLEGVIGSVHMLCPPSSLSWKQPS